MTPENFTYWLQGMLEGKSSLTPEQQIKMIQDHLNLVMNKVTPNISSPAADWTSSLTIPTTGGRLC